MADLTFEFYNLDGNIVQLGKLKSYELCKESDAPCDGLRVTFVNQNILPELYAAKAFANGKCVFNGFVDTQRETVHNDYVICFLYCRSSACLLTDSEAKPITYTSPSAMALFEVNAGEGFKYNLGNVYSDIRYSVSKGTSLFGALNGFVYSVTGKNIRITPENEITFLQSDRKVKLETDKIVSVKRIINRGNALAKTDYKISNSTDYIYHRESGFMKRKKIESSSIRNLSSVPDWQRETKLHSYFASANSDYCGWEITLCGFVDVDLKDSVVAAVDGFDEYQKVVADAVTHSCNSSGEFTVIKANCVFDLEEMSYVDE